MRSRNGWRGFNYAGDAAALLWATTVLALYLLQFSGLVQDVGRQLVGGW